MRAKSSGSSDAPPTSAPSISGIAMSSAMLPGFTLPPYWMRIASAVVVAVEVARARPGSRRWSSLASSGVALRPVPIAQIGS